MAAPSQVVPKITRIAAVLLRGNADSQTLSAAVSADASVRLPAPIVPAHSAYAWGGQTSWINATLTPDVCLRLMVGSP